MYNRWEWQMGATHGLRYRHCRLASSCEEESTAYPQGKENRKMVWILKLNLSLSLSFSFSLSLCGVCVCVCVRVRVQCI